MNLNMSYVLPFMLFDNVSILLVCIPLTRVADPDPTSEKNPDPDPAQFKYIEKFTFFPLPLGQFNQYLSGLDIFVV